jgi:hypothetical protein
MGGESKRKRGVVFDDVAASDDDLHECVPSGTNLSRHEALQVAPPQFIIDAALASLSRGARQLQWAMPPPCVAVRRHSPLAHADVLGQGSPPKTTHQRNGGHSHGVSAASVPDGPHTAMGFAGAAGGSAGSAAAAAGKTKDGVAIPGPNADVDPDLDEARALASRLAAGHDASDPGGHADLPEGLVPLLCRARGPAHAALAAAQWRPGVLAAVCAAFAAAAPPARAAAAFARHVLAPVAAQLEGPAPREIFAGFREVASVAPAVVGTTLAEALIEENWAAQPKLCVSLRSFFFFFFVFFFFFFFFGKRGARAPKVVCVFAVFFFFFFSFFFFSFFFSKPLTHPQLHPPPSPPGTALPCSAAGDESPPTAELPKPDDAPRELGSAQSELLTRLVTSAVVPAACFAGPVTRRLARHGWGSGALLPLASTAASGLSSGGPGTEEFVHAAAGACAAVPEGAGMRAAKLLLTLVGKLPAECLVHAGAVRTALRGISNGVARAALRKLDALAPPQS